MKHLLAFAGLIIFLKGVAACIAIVESLSVASISSAYGAGVITGRAIVALAFLVGGAGLIKRAWPVATPTPPAA